jgi:hypothetical protein
MMMSEKAAVMTELFTQIDSGGGKLSENECRGVARLLNIDEHQFWRMVRCEEIGYPEFDQAMTCCFQLNTLKREGPTDLVRSIHWAIDNLKMDPSRGFCTITWKGGAPTLVLDRLKPIIEAWDCWNMGYSQMTLQMLPTPMICVTGLNALCPSNPASASCTWPDLQALLAAEGGKIMGVHAVVIKDCGYLVF